MKIPDELFDKEDALLFSYSDDLLLKAKAIKNSILPKLNLLLQASVSLIREIYEIEVFDEDSTISKYPSFRENRPNDLKLDYTNAFVGLCGNRLPIWNGLCRDDGKVVKILPIRYGFELSGNGLLVYIFLNNQIRLSVPSFQKLFYVLAENIETIIATANHFSFQLDFPQSKNDLFSSLARQIKKLAKSSDEASFEFYMGKYISLSIEQDEMDSLPLYFAVIFPVYDALLRAAKDEKNRFKELTGKLQNWLCTFPKGDNMKPQNASPASAVKENAEKKIDTIGIRASIRWQVFERDNFRCVACGATALDGAILHVDHILPRSKGGKDTMENYQTLCQTCNGGKSNRSEQNLRERV